VCYVQNYKKNVFFNFTIWKVEGLARLIFMCYRVAVMMLQSDRYGVTEKRLWCYRVRILVLQCKDFGVTQ
jgi:hypothetical protein